MTFRVIAAIAVALLSFTQIVSADTAMTVVAAGSFRMGSDEFAPAHTVMIKPFALAKHPVTRGEFETFVNATGYDAGRGWRKPLFKQNGDNDPVINVSWLDAQAYIDWLNEKTGEHYRLPTEAEWEYAARAGTVTPYYWGNEIGKDHADCNACGSRWDGDSTAPVASFAANPWGFFDMGGNAAQWVQDCFDETYDHAPDDGSAVNSGNCSQRVARGGGWSDASRAVRVDAREGYLPGFRYMNVGFRVAKDE